MATKKTIKKTEAAEQPQKNAYKLKSAGWLVELAFRIFVGGVMVTKFDHVVALAAGFYALGTAVLVIGYHVVLANKK